MKFLLSVLACCAGLIAPFLQAGTDVDEKTAVASNQTATEAVPLDLFEFQTAYVFESDLNHGGSHGKQDEIQSEFEYGHRIQLHDKIYLHLGISYERYDFGSTHAPVPDHLQAFAGVVGIDIMHGKDVGAFIEFRPGFYTEDNFGISSFDVPIAAGMIFVVIGHAGPNTKIIPGHGPTVDRNAVIAHRDLVLTVRDRVARLVDQGQTEDQAVAAKVTADLDSKVQEVGMTAERFVRQVYQELKANR